MPATALAPAPPPVFATLPITPHGWRLNIADTPPARAAAARFTGRAGEATRGFLDTALPECRRMVDLGAGAGLASLYAAAQGAAVDCFEPRLALLDANLAANPRLAGRIRLHRHAIGAHDALAGPAATVVPLRAAADALAALGLGSDMLLRIDIGGGEYRLVPAIAGLLARHRPFLLLSFHPAALARGADAYLADLASLRGSLALAEAIAPYRHMYFHTEQGWTRIDRRDRASLLAQYLLKPKPVRGQPAAHYGFTDTLALSEVALPLG